jgi:hypothetical protein
MEKESRDHTFRPSLVADSSRLGSEFSSQDFMERQVEFQRRQQERRQRQRDQEGHQYTFKPQINVTSDVIIEQTQNRQHENLVDKVD